MLKPAPRTHWRFCKIFAASPPLEAISSKGGDCHVLYGKSAERALTCGVEAELEAYAPLVRSVAWRYAGRGAEFEDLVQEGCLALLVLIPRCPDRRWLARYLKTNLPGYVRDAAARMRKPITNGGETMTEELEATLGRDEERYEETELRETLERLLTREELDITQALVEGFTQAEIAKGLGVTQQAVAARVKKIRAKLRSSFYDENGETRRR